jgi:hypothetical protein
LVVEFTTVRRYREKHLVVEFSLQGMCHLGGASLKHRDIRKGRRETQLFEVLTEATDRCSSGTPVCSVELRAYMAAIIFGLSLEKSQ